MSAGSYSDFFTAVGHLESGNNYSYVSPAGYLGYYQFAEETLQAAGFYNGDGNTAVRDFAGGWTSLAASYGVTDKASFLAHPAAQDAAATAWFQKVYADLGALDLIKYDDQTLNGFTLTPSALLAGSHLVGVWALKDYLTSGGATVPQDGGGETVLDYMSRLSGYATPFAFDHSGPMTLSGGSGPDNLHGWAAADSLSGGDGGDTLRGLDGADTVMGGAGADQLNGNRGDDVVDGGSGGADTLMGGQGNDRVTAHAGDVSLNGNMGDDTVAGGSGADTVHGGQGADLVSGGAGADQIYGDLGDDTLAGGTGADVFHFAAGGGHDRVTDFTLTEGDRVHIDDGAAYSVAQVGADAVLTLASGDQLTLTGVSKDALGTGWII
jgi:Ca2+-binding RTX toxin-like protein